MPSHTPHAWWQTGVIYQIYPRSFKDSTGNGVGDLGGIIEKLDYLSDTLGVDVIWLSPFYPSPMADFGYDVADFTDVHPLFGDLETFDTLVAETHARGLKLIVDFVPNHSSDQHAWFVDSRASRDNPRRDWYVWEDPKPDGSPPNNWLSVFGGPAWTYDEATGQYYLHSFLKEQPDLNWRNPAVQDAMFDALRFWLDRGVDGFRIDVAHYIMKDPEMRDNPLNTAAEGDFYKAMGDYDSQIHLYNKGHEDIHPLFQALRQLVDTYPDERPRLTVGEIHLFEWDKWARYYGENLDELHMPFNFSLLHADRDAAALRKLVDELEAALPEGAWPNYVLGNHDEARLATRYGEAGSRLASLLLLTLRGTPTLYYGDEIGIPQSDIPSEKQQDPWGRRVPGLGRDGCRTPMAWTEEPEGGFTTTTTPWLPLHDDYPTRNVAHQQTDSASLLTLYRKLLTLRKNTPALQVGDYHPLDKGSDTCFVFQRQTADQTILVALNFSENRQPLALDTPGLVLLSTHPGRRAGAILMTLTLDPNEGVIVQMST